MSTLFFTDLDGTMIFSAQKKRETDIIVEYKDGVPISCMSARQLELFGRLGEFVPVTTRSIEQYRRISFPNGYTPRYAITDNGGNLLVEGTPDEKWAREMLGFTKKREHALDMCRELLERDPHRSFEIRMVDGLFLFTKTVSPQDTLEALAQLHADGVNSFCVGAKVYVMPQELDKGAAVIRLRERLGHTGLTAAAGDSLMDVPLLNTADIAMFADTIPEQLITAGEKHVHPKDRFPDFVTEKMAELQGG